MRLQVADGAQRFLEGCLDIRFVKVQQVDVVRAELAQAVLDVLENPLARLSAFIGSRAYAMAEFRRQNPMVAMIPDRPTDDRSRA